MGDKVNITISDSFVTGQTSIGTTGTPEHLPAAPLSNGITIFAPSANAASIVIGYGSANANNLTNGTGLGYILAAGTSVSIPISNLSQVWINGTAADIVSWIGC